MPTGIMHLPSTTRVRTFHTLKTSPKYATLHPSLSKWSMTSPTGCGPLPSYKTMLVMSSND